MGFLDELVGKSPRTKGNPSPPYLAYIDDVEVGELVIPSWLIAAAIIGAAGTAFMILERIAKRVRARRE